MSAENSRLSRAIQRIAREDPELRRAIEGAKPRGGQPVGVGVGESDGERDRLCCDGSVSGAANPGATERDSSDGQGDGLDPNDPAELGEMGGGCLSGVTDCDTEESICFCGTDWVPPTGFSDYGTVSPDSLWWHDPEYYWSNTNSLAGSSHHRRAPMQVLVALKDGNSTVDIGSAYYASDGHVRYLFGGGFLAGDIFRQRCDSERGQRICPGLDDPDIVWPSDSCVKLAIKNGSIVGSKYDPENDGSYSAPRDEIELCDPENGTSILLRPSADGGWKSIKSLDGDIDPETGYGYLYRPNGQRVRQISPSEFRDDTV